MTDSIQILPVESDEQAPEELPSEVPEETTEDTLLAKTTEQPSLFVKQEYKMNGEDAALADEAEDSADGLQINDEETALSFEGEQGEIEIETKAGESLAVLLVLFVCNSGFQAF